MPERRPTTRHRWTAGSCHCPRSKNSALTWPTLIHWAPLLLLPSRHSQQLAWLSTRRCPSCRPAPWPIWPRPARLCQPPASRPSRPASPATRSSSSASGHCASASRCSTSSSTRRMSCRGGWATNWPNGGWNCIDRWPTARWRWRIRWPATRRRLATPTCRCWRARWSMRWSAHSSTNVAVSTRLGCSTVARWKFAACCTSLRPASCQALIRIWSAD